MVVLSLIAMATSLVGNILVNFKKRIGFIIWLVSNVLWILVNLFGELNVPQVAMFIVYAGLNIDGYFRWKNKEDKHDKS